MQDKIDYFYGQKNNRISRRQLNLLKDPSRNVSLEGTNSRANTSNLRIKKRIPKL